MMESILLDHVLEKIQLNGEMLVIDGSNAGFEGYNNLLASLKIVSYQKQDRL